MNKPNYKSYKRDKAGFLKYAEDLKKYFNYLEGLLEEQKELNDHIKNTNKEYGENNG